MKFAILAESQSMVIHSKAIGCTVEKRLFSMELISTGGRCDEPPDFT